MTRNFSSRLSRNEARRRTVFSVCPIASPSPGTIPISARPDCGMIWLVLTRISRFRPPAKVTEPVAWSWMTRPLSVSLLDVDGLVADVPLDVAVLEQPAAPRRAEELVEFAEDRERHERGVVEVEGEPAAGLGDVSAGSGPVRVMLPESLPELAFELMAPIRERTSRSTPDRRRSEWNDLSTRGATRRSLRRGPRPAAPSSVGRAPCRCRRPG